MLRIALTIALVIAVASESHTQLTLAKFHGAQLDDTDFTGSNWWRARGLPLALLPDLKKKYAPKADGDQSRYRDYQRWLQSTAKGE